PFISFNRSAGQGTISAEIMVKAEGPASAVGGPAFRFGSIDLYSSITTIPYVFTGLRSSNVVFTETGTVPNTFGNFATVLNPRAGAEINALLITLSNPATPSCPICSNPVGLDNIVVA